MGEVLFLVRSSVSPETVDALNHLLLEAKAGRIVGIAYAAIHPGYAYSAGVAGETKRIPTFTRGIVNVLDDELAKLSGPGEA